MQIADVGAKQMIDLDLTQYSLADLVAHREEVDKAIEQIKKKEIANFKEEVEAKAKLLGIPLEEVFGGVQPSTTRAKAKPKYQHPTDSSKTWTGKGKRPSWVVEHEEAGGDRSELLIR